MKLRGNFIVLESVRELVFAEQECSKNDRCYECGYYMCCNHENRCWKMMDIEECHDEGRVELQIILIFTLNKAA